VTTTGDGTAVGSPPAQQAEATGDRSRLEALESAIDYCALHDQRTGTTTSPDEVLTVAEKFRRWLIRTGQLPDTLDTN
jgi:hypothetical protein